MRFVRDKTTKFAALAFTCLGAYGQRASAVTLDQLNGVRIQAV